MVLTPRGCLPLSGPFQVKGYADYLLFDDLPLDHYMHVVNCLRNPNLDLFLVLVRLSVAQVGQVNVLRKRGSSVPNFM